MADWEKRFLDLTTHISTWSSCLRRQVGAIIVKDKQILATGYNGAPTKVKSCKERGYCNKDLLGYQSATGHDICFAAHAEMNAISQAAKNGVSIKDTILYCNYSPCSLCAKLIINSGIKEVHYIEKYEDKFAEQLLNEAGIICRKSESSI